MLHSLTVRIFASSPHPNPTCDSLFLFYFPSFSFAFIQAVVLCHVNSVRPVGLKGCSAMPRFVRIVVALWGRRSRSLANTNVGGSTVTLMSTVRRVSSTPRRLPSRQARCFRLFWYFCFLPNISVKERRKFSMRKFDPRNLLARRKIFHTIFVREKDHTRHEIPCLGRGEEPRTHHPHGTAAL